MNEALFERLVPGEAKAVNVRSVCDSGICRVLLFGPVMHKFQGTGLLLMELYTRTIQDQIQLVTLQRTDYFSGLTDSSGTLVLGPENLVGHKIQVLFGISPDDLSRATSILEPRGSETAKEPPVAIAGGTIQGTGFYLVQVAPRSRFVAERSHIPWVVAFVSLLSGLLIMLIQVFTSYSQGNLMYEQLQDAHDHLEVRVTERTAELNEVNRKLVGEISERKRAEHGLRETGKDLEAANRDLKEFAYVVSHDLKAPLRSVRQLAHWIGEDYAEVLDAVGKEYVEKLIGRVKLMHDLIEDILQYSKIGRVREEKAVVNLESLVQDAIRLVAPPPSMAVVIENKLPSMSWRTYQGASRS